MTAVPQALWPSRWPTIALQECVDIVNAAPAEARAETLHDLPCETCPENVRCQNAKRKELGPLLFSREIRTRPIASESSLFPREMFDPMLIDQPCLPYWHKPVSVEYRFGVAEAWDIAWSEKVAADWLVHVVGVIDRNTGLRRLLDIERWQGKTFPQQMLLMEARWGQWQSDVVTIETDASQAVWVQWLESTTDVPVIGHRAKGEKKDLQKGVPSLLIDFANKRWRIPWVEGGRHHDNIETLIDEFEAFTWIDGKLEGVGEHDDTVMAFWHLSWTLDMLRHHDPRKIRDITRGGGRRI